MNFDLASFAIGVVVGIVAVFYMIRAWYNSMIKKFIDIVEAASEKEESNIVPLRVEVENGQYLCYNSDSNEFVCQGSSVQEITAKFKQRFPGSNAFLKDGDENALSALRSQLKRSHDTDSNNNVQQ